MAAIGYADALRVYAADLRAVQDRCAQWARDTTARELAPPQEQ